MKAGRKQLLKLITLFFVSKNLHRKMSCKSNICHADSLCTWMQSQADDFSVCHRNISGYCDLSRVIQMPRSTGKNNNKNNYNNNSSVKVFNNTELLCMKKFSFHVSEKWGYMCFSLSWGYCFFNGYISMKGIEPRLYPVFYNVVYRPTTSEPPGCLAMSVSPKFLDLLEKSRHVQWDLYFNELGNSCTTTEIWKKWLF